MSFFNLDIFNTILSLLQNDIDKFNLITTCKEMMKCDYSFDQYHNFNKIFKSILFDNFTNIFIPTKDEI